MKPAASTSTAVTTFQFEGNGLDVIEIDGNPWFAAATICKILKLSDVSDAVEKLDADEKGTSLTRTLGGLQNSLIVNESGLWTLVLRSRDAMVSD